MLLPWRLRTASSGLRPASLLSRETQMTETANHALQRTAPCVTAPASAAAFPPTMQVPRRTPRSLSLGSLGDFAYRLLRMNRPAFVFLAVVIFCISIARAGELNPRTLRLDVTAAEFRAALGIAFP